jgi:hypothetical protein
MQQSTNLPLLDYTCDNASGDKRSEGADDDDLAVLAAGSGVREVAVGKIIRGATVWSMVNSTNATINELTITEVFESRIFDFTCDNASGDKRLEGADDDDLEVLAAGRVVREVAVGKIISQNR